MNLKAWMANIDDKAPLFQLNLVGTHDCVTQYVQFSHISKCQNSNIHDQLSIGIRGLDIRVQSKGKRLGMVHGIAKVFVSPSHLSRQMELKDVLQQCFKFLNENGSECIVFQFKNDSGREQEKCFDNLYNTYISANPEKWYLENREPSLGESRGKIVLIRRCNMYAGKKYPLGTGIDFSSWIEQTTLQPDALALNTGGENAMSFIIQDRYKYKPIPRWSECIMPFLDKSDKFSGKYIINYLSTAGGLKGPYNNSKYINKKFMQYTLDNSLYYGMIYTDFPTKELTQKIISTNFR